MRPLEVLCNQLPQQLGTENEIKQVSALLTNRCTCTTAVVTGHKKVVKEIPTKKVQ